MNLYRSGFFAFCLLVFPSLSFALEQETAQCHVSLVEITPDGFNRSPAAVAEFQSATARGGECADEMKKHVKDFAHACRSPNHVLAEINFTAGNEKSVQAELAMECGDDSKRNPASAETDDVNRYIDEAYNQIQSNYDRHPLTGLKLRDPVPNRTGDSSKKSISATHGVVYESENVHLGKRKWLENHTAAPSQSASDEVVERNVIARQLANAETRAETADQNAYIQEFIRNAKADGWSIRVKDGQIQVMGRSR
jgi:hypothetical protein